jgi:hypothetical protein
MRPGSQHKVLPVAKPLAHDRALDARRQPVIGFPPLFSEIVMSDSKSYLENLR